MIIFKSFPFVTFIYNVTAPIFRERFNVPRRGRVPYGNQSPHLRFSVCRWQWSSNHTSPWCESVGCGSTYHLPRGGSGSPTVWEPRRTELPTSRQYPI